MQNIYSTGDVARLLGIPAHKFTYAISTGALPEPVQRNANQRCFSEEDVRRIATYFQLELPNQIIDAESKEEQ